MSEPQAPNPTPEAPPAAAMPPPPAAQRPVETAAAGWYAGQSQPFDPRRKSPRLAAILSVVPGLGQVYIGYYVRGFVLAGSALMLILVANTTREPLAVVAGMSMFFLWLFNLIDAGRMAALYNHAVAGTRAIELPDDFKMPSMGGSVAGGALLMVFGLIALSNTLLGFSLEWIENWWPVFPLAVGGYLLARGMQDRDHSQGYQAPGE